MIVIVQFYHIHIANWDRRFDHRIRLAKKSFEDDIIDHPSTRAIASGRYFETKSYIITYENVYLLRKYKYNFFLDRNLDIT